MIKKSLNNYEGEERKMAIPKSEKNMFSAALTQREQEQQTIEATVAETHRKAPIGGGKVRKRGLNATTMTLSVSLEDKIRIKEYAARKCMSVSDLLHIWIEEACSEEQG